MVRSLAGMRDQGTLSERLAAEGMPSEVRNWHLVDPAVARRIGRELLRQQW